MRRGEIWLVNLDPTVGAEIRKTRPVVIVSNDAVGVLPLKVIVPITDWKDRYAIADWMVKIAPDDENNLDKESAADTFQVRSIAKERFVRKTGKLTNEVLQKIVSALAIVLSIE